jgi:hypothetical protein
LILKKVFKSIIFITGEIQMKILLYVCSTIAIILGIYEFFWISKSSLAFVLILFSFILAINSIALARKEK